MPKSRSGVAEGKSNDRPQRAARSIAEIVRARMLGVRPRLWRSG